MLSSFLCSWLVFLTLNRVHFHTKRSSGEFCGFLLHFLKMLSFDEFRIYALFSRRVVDYGIIEKVWYDDVFTCHGNVSSADVMVVYCIAWLNSLVVHCIHSRCLPFFIVSPLFWSPGLSSSMKLNVKNSSQLLFCMCFLSVIRLPYRSIEKCTFVGVLSTRAAEDALCSSRGCGCSILRRMSPVFRHWMAW